MLSVNTVPAWVLSLVICDCVVFLTHLSNFDRVNLKTAVEQSSDEDDGEEQDSDEDDFDDEDDESGLDSDDDQDESGPDSEDDQDESEDESDEEK